MILTKEYPYKRLHISYMDIMLNERVFSIKYEVFAKISVDFDTCEYAEKNNLTEKEIISLINKRSLGVYWVKAKHSIKISDIDNSDNYFSSELDSLIIIDHKELFLKNLNSKDHEEECDITILNKVKDIDIQDKSLNKFKNKLENIKNISI
jgi:hypothetical protein